MQVDQASLACLCCFLLACSVMTAAQEPLLPPSRASGLEAGGSSSRLFEELPWQIPHRRQSGAGERSAATAAAAGGSPTGGRHPPLLHKGAGARSP